MNKSTPLEQLTKREHEVLKLVTTGKTNPEIAKMLSISTFTARNHVCHVLAKLHLERRVELVLMEKRFECIIKSQ